MDDPFIVNILKQNGQISGAPKNGAYSLAQVTLSFTRMREKLNEIRNDVFESSDNGEAYIQVDFSKEESLIVCSQFDHSGFTYEELEGFIDALYESIPESMKG
ncbi:MAG: hypothetical protein JKY52_10895 [Flavobacteriales bacterium]|nr:hypothetical protein [Flavobacteriales bacterium]